MRQTANKIFSHLRFGAGLGSFLRERISLDDARAIMRDRVENRDRNFLRMIRDGVFGNLRSPYRSMLDGAGIELARIEHWVETLGVEGTLLELRNQGIFVSYEQFKAANAAQAGEDGPFGKNTSFLNPWVGPGVSARSSATRSQGTQIVLSVSRSREFAAQRLYHAAEFGFFDCVRAIYFPILPSAGAISSYLWGNYIGQPFVAWFAPVDPKQSPLKYRAATFYILTTIRWASGRRFCPKYVPLSDVSAIVRWLADMKRKRQKVILTAYASACVRICETAVREGLDIAGTGFFVVGEPFTQARHDTIVAAGGISICCYGSVDAGPIGNVCRHSRTQDDMHLMTDSLAFITSERTLPQLGVKVNPLMITTLLPGSALVLLNVELDDYGELSERPCDCEWGRLGMYRRIRNVRSFVKLTAEGMTFVGSRLIDVLERELPARFGGGPSDYQLIEEEDSEGRTRLSLRVHPHLGDIDEAEAIALLLKRVRSTGKAGPLSEQMWRGSNAIRVVHKAPFQTSGGKVLPFHTLRPSR